MSQAKTARTKDGDSQEQIYILLCALGGAVLLICVLAVWFMWGSNQTPTPNSSSASTTMIMMDEEKKPDTSSLPQVSQQPQTRGRNPSSDGGSGPARTGSDNGNSTRSSSNSDVLRSYSGSGHKTLPPFKVDGSWKVQWKADKFFAAYLRDAESGKLVDTLGDSQKEGSPSASGKYYLEVAASGNWSVKVVKSK